MKIVIFPKKNGNRIIGINVDIVECVDNFGRKNRIFCKNAEILMVGKIFSGFSGRKNIHKPGKEYFPGICGYCG